MHLTHAELNSALDHLHLVAGVAQPAECCIGEWKKGGREGGGILGSSVVLPHHPTHPTASRLLPKCVSQDVGESGDCPAGK